MSNRARFKKEGRYEQQIERKARKPVREAGSGGEKKSGVRDQGRAKKARQ